MDSPVKKNSAEEEIRLLRRISEQSPDAVIRIDADGNILYANPAGRSLIEYWDSGVGQLVPDGWEQLIANTLASGKSREMEIQCGEMVISFHAVPTPDDSCVILYGRDITARKRTEHELRQKEERFALVLRGTNDGIWDFDLRTGEIHFSPRWEEMLGYQEHEIANHFKAWQDLIHPEDLGQVLEVWMECMEGLTESFATEYRIRTKSGVWMWVQCRGLALQDADQLPIRLAGSHTDITDRKQVEFLQIRYHEGLIRLDQRVRELIGVAGQSQKFFDLVCDGILDLVNADLGALPMIDESGDTFTYVAATGAMAKLVHNQTMLVQGGGLCGWVVEHGEVLRIADIADDSRATPQLAKALNVSTALLVPIRQANQIVGGLSAFRKPAPFDDIDEQLLTLFGQRVSAALDNLRLLLTLEDQKERAQITLQSIGDAVITTDSNGHIDYMNPVAEQ
ncbi:MAG: PAS domain S-box protein, partial [Gammaproteobacteria bacterium]